MGNWPFPAGRERDWVPAGGDLVTHGLPTAGLVWPFNFTLSEVHAAVGTLALQRLDGINAQRQRQAERFMAALSEFEELRFPAVPPGRSHVYHLMIGSYHGEEYGASRDALMSLLREQFGMACIVQYWPLHRSELFGSFGLDAADVPHTDAYFARQISFPW